MLESFAREIRKREPGLTPEAAYVRARTSPTSRSTASGRQGPARRDLGPGRRVAPPAGPVSVSAAPPRRREHERRCRDGVPSYTPAARLRRSPRDGATLLMAQNLISIAFEDFAQSLRVQAEAWMRLRMGLLAVDRQEAVGNVETSLSSVLNAFHSLYDAIEKELGAHPVDWYSTPELATVLALRNARHHNKANRIRTLYTYHAHEAKSPMELVDYVLVDFPSTGEDDEADTMDQYCSWSDLDLLLSLPKPESRLQPEACKLIRDYLGSDRFGTYSRRYRLPKKRVFINVTPLQVNAAAVIVPVIRERIRPLSLESDFFSNHFATVARSSTTTPQVQKLRFFLPH